MLRAIFAMLALAGAAQASTLANAYCQPFGTDSAVTTASCNGGNAAAQSASNATSTADYGVLSATASSAYGFQCGVAVGCQPDSAASAEFVQTMMFTGFSGNGMLLFTGGSMSQENNFNRHASLTINGKKYVSVFPGPLAIAITAGEAVTVDGYVAASASDANGISAFMNLGAFSVLDSGGNVLRRWNGLASMDSVVYSVALGTATAAVTTPEPAVFWLAGTGLAVLFFRKRR